MNILTPRQALNKAYLKQKVYQQHLEKFRINFLRLLEHRNAEEGEEHNKKLLSTFLEDTWYKNLHYINTSGRTDMAIYEKPSSDSHPVVLIETKRPGNSSEMPSTDNPNTKALHELISYYLYQRVEKDNKHIKHLVITDLEAFFIFDENEFDRFFYGDRQLVKDYKEFKNSGKSADFFYKEIARPFVDGMQDSLTLTHFTVKKFQSLLKSDDPDKTRKLIPYFKLFSPEHLLKKPFANDSNTLDRNFYHELLHIIGLKEVKKGSQKLIQRAPEEEREAGSLMENTITILEAENTVHYMAGREKYGSNREEQIYNVALELVITWVNRVLFLKLLEAQLVRYHRNDKSYKFLNFETLADYDALNKLFFQVLAVEPHQRNENVRERFAKVPYLNSSLFETNELERKTIRISSLENEFDLTYMGHTVLKDNKGRRRKGKENTIHYLFEFLEAYDFASEGSEDIQEENKNLINASVLGLIFEKINGYRDGSFFTPGFITEYMARETIRRAVVQKFNEQKGWQVEDFDALRDKIDPTPEGRTEANTIINSLKIVDPAVGSGHFLVSALNEIIALKSELKVLCYQNGDRIRYYHARVENDELIIEDDEEGSIFEYQLSRSHTLIKEKQEVQEAIFHEKQTIIENCLFGVDINPNSVKICRLRLWIELLKNAYYRESNNAIPSSATPQSSRLSYGTGSKGDVPPSHKAHNTNKGVGALELQTLPNIDINIKVGNSLVSRFALDDSLKKALSSSKWSIDSYRVAVHTYRNAEDKEQKREMQVLIDDIKSDFTTNIDTPFKKKLSNAKAKQINTLTEINTKQQWNERIPAELKKNLNNASKRVVKLEEEKKEIENSVIYRNAFEWRFEFPEVLDDDGNFIGFDVVIGNPPYIPLESIKNQERKYYKEVYSILKRKYDTSAPFFLRGLSLLRDNSFISYIAPITWQTGENYADFRELIYFNYGIDTVINLPFDVFSDAYVETAIYILSTNLRDSYKIYRFDKHANINTLENIHYENISVSNISKSGYKLILDVVVNKILKRFNNHNIVKLGDISISTQGLSASRFEPVLPNGNKNIYPFLSKGNVYNYCLSVDEFFYTSLDNNPTLKPFYEETPKILIRRIINRKDRLTVGYTENKMVFKKDINPFIITDECIKTKYVLGVLASKLVSYIYVNISSIATKDDFRQTTLTELRSIPIPNISVNLQNEFIKHVDRILEAKQSDNFFDTSNLEKKIDEEVYKLYGLTNEEIEIVEACIA